MYTERAEYDDSGCQTGTFCPWNHFIVLPVMLATGLGAWDPSESKPIKKGLADGYHSTPSTLKEQG